MPAAPWSCSFAADEEASAADEFAAAAARPADRTTVGAGSGDAPERDGTLAADTFKREFGGASIIVLSAKRPCLCVFDLATRIAVGRHYVLCGTAEYLRC